MSTPIEQDIDSYLMGRFKLLGLEAASRTRVYLDTNYWAKLRDEITGVRSDPEIRQLLTLLRERVSSEKMICTFSTHTLSEIMKHASVNTQAATATLMDELSHGFCVANEERLLHNELNRWLYGWMNPQGERYPLEVLAWARPAFLGIDAVPPRIEGLDADSQWSLQQGFIDRMWNMSMSEVMTGFHQMDTPYPSLDWPQEAADTINEEIRDHDNENTTKKSLYLSEIDGLLDWLGDLDMFLEGYEEMANTFGGLIPTTQLEREACIRALQNTIRALASKGAIVQELPSIHIRASLHAAIRWNKRRSFNANGLVDIEHAQTALPLCNFFFTDGPHAHLVKSDAKLDKVYDCKIAGTPAEAIALLSI